MGRKKTPRETSETQQTLMAAALEIVGTKGMEGATARAIADVAGVNQSLIFYHFGSVTELLIAAVNDMSDSRFAAYEKALSQATTMDDLLKITFEVFEEDRHGPSYIVLSQFVSGAQNIDAIATALEPLFEKFIVLTRDCLQRVLGDIELPVGLTFDDIAMGVISLFLGVRLIGSIPKYDSNVDSLLEKVRDVGPLINMLMVMFPKKS